MNNQATSGFGYLEFDPFSCPLSGVNLVEASAGTGKTYSITSVYLRFILESSLQVENILVVTFTEAATAELNDRIRTRLKDCLESVKSGFFTDKDPFGQYFSGLDDNYKINAVPRLETAIRSFDKASIFTIHGFCRRILSEMAFETGAMFDFKLEPDLSDLESEIISDYLRTLFLSESVAEFPESFLMYLVKVKFFSGVVDKLISRSRSFPRISISEILSGNNLHKISGSFEMARKTALKMWNSGKGEITECFIGASTLNGKSYNPGIRKRILEKININLENAGPDFFVSDDFRKITFSSIKNGTIKGNVPPFHEFFNLCENLYKSADILDKAYCKRLNSMKQEFLDYYYSESEKRKEKRNACGFNDLLAKLHNAISGPYNEIVRGSIRKKFHAALIDEFQDTDHVQYDIFSNTFRNYVPLFLIGDPKQSIYGFRGADVFAYIRAASEADRKYTLTTNWRSDSGLIKAVNHLFSVRKNPFVFSEIQYLDVKASSENTESAFKSGRSGDDKGFLEIFAISDKTNDTKKKSDAVICEYVTSRIAELISGNAEIAGKPVVPGDIAVLVAKHAQGKKIRSFLDRAGIPSVSSGGEGVFKSDEALYIARLIGAVINPSDAGRMKGALTTPFFGFTANDIENMDNNEEILDKTVIFFRDLHDLWARKNFIQMFRKAITREGVSSRMAASAGGERTLTNLYHIAEIINHEETSGKLSMDEVLDMLAERIESGEKGIDEELLRLESDSDAVRIMTVHKSKGLEFPIVFCPFPVKNISDKKPDGVIVHDSEDDHSFMYYGDSHPDFDLKRKKHDTMELAESSRLLYVALTRAKHRCFMAVDLDSCVSSIGYILFHSEITGSDEALVSLKDCLKKTEPEDKLSILKQICSLSGSSISLSEYNIGNADKILPEKKNEISLELGKFERRIRTDSLITSFSGITAGTHSSAPDPDIPEAHLQEKDFSSASIHINPDSADLKKTIFDFPKGRDAGNFFHSFLENLDFGSDFPAIRTLAGKILQEYGFDISWSDVVAEMALTLVNTTLPGTDFTLSSVGKKSRINEAGFYFPVKKMTPENLADAFSDLGTEPEIRQIFKECLDRLEFYPVSGFIRGFIDMIFEKDGRYYLVDWKSNHLGNACDAYSDAALAETMASEYYIIQYYLYVIAVDRYLKNRVAGYSFRENFGGVFYFFLRGVNGQGKNGIYHDMPDEAFIKKLSSGIFA